MNSLKKGHLVIPQYLSARQTQLIDAVKLRCQLDDVQKNDEWLGKHIRQLKYLYIHRTRKAMIFFYLFLFS